MQPLHVFWTKVELGGALQDIVKVHTYHIWFVFYITMGQSQ